MQEYPPLAVRWKEFWRIGVLLTISIASTTLAHQSSSSGFEIEESLKVELKLERK